MPQDQDRSVAASQLHELIDRFSLTDGAAFDLLGVRLGELGRLAASAPRRAALLWGLAWVVPFLLCLASGTAASYLADWGVWARFFIAVPLLVLIDRAVDERLRRHLREFMAAPLIAPTSLETAAAAVATAIDRGRSRVGLALCLALAVALGLAGIGLVSARHATSWLVNDLPDGSGPTLAGWWVGLVGSPVFWFLLLRWLWRHLIWALLLRRLAGLELRLVATHPDGAGGLGFLGRYPNVFAAVVLAMSITLAAAIAQAIQHDALSLHAYSILMAVWLAVVVALFAFPLTAFAKPLAELKATTLCRTSAEGTRYFRAAERKILGTNAVAAAPDEPAGTAEDPSKLHAAAQKLHTIPFSRAALLPIGAASLLPLLAAGAVQVPFGELWKVVKRLLLL